MAQLKGSVQFSGSIGSIRSYYNKKLKRYILSTKGGAPKEKIMNSPVFARTRENMSEFKACGMWASQLRKSLIIISHLNWPAKFQSFRFSLVIAQLPDYVWKEDELQYRPLYNDMEMLSVATFSEWYPNNTSLIDISLSASFVLFYSYEHIDH